MDVSRLFVMLYRICITRSKVKPRSDLHPPLPPAEAGRENTYINTKILPVRTTSITTATTTRKILIEFRYDIGLYFNFRLEFQYLSNLLLKPITAIL